MIDQLGCLLEREGQRERVDTTTHDPELSRRARALAECLPSQVSRDDPAALREAAAKLAELCATLESERSGYRELAASDTAADRLGPEDAIMNAYRWLERSAHHTWRVTHRLDQLSRDAPSEILVEPSEPD